ncbi:MAG: UvrD-helicase domain-containing protein [Chitinophagaceae bacterium]
MSENINDIEIIDADVSYAEEHFGIQFNDDQKNVIKCLKTVDVQACPGSGKTTSLAAKLFILANKLPPTFNKGVCIITHTNVAVNEIKHKLGDAGARFFKYPNHFGTIQSFVDKFLTIPGYVTEFKKRPYRIDDETYFRYIESKFNSTYNYRKSLFSLSQRSIDPHHLRFSCEDFSLVKSIYGAAIGLNPTTETMVNALKCKTEVLKDGYICFEDAYSIALKYLRTYPKLKTLFENRFAYVFVDEMQDMDSFQANVLHDLFNLDSPNICIQRIGDINQAIFSSSYSNSDGRYWEPKNHLEIKISIRLSKEIAAKVHNVSISPQELGGREDTPQIPPVIIAFDDNTNIGAVKTKFAELIFEHKLHETKSPIFKAVGLKKNHGKGLDSKKNLKLSIKDYFDEYNQTLSYKQKEYDCFSEYLTTNTKSISLIRESFIQGIIKGLKLGEVINPTNQRPFTSSSLTKYLADYHPDFWTAMRYKIAGWLKQIATAKFDCLEEMIKYATTDFWAIWGKEINDGCKTFFITKKTTANETAEAEVLSNNNLFRIEKDGSIIPIQFSTIHSVKGETHCATLYLETYNRTFDIEKIIPFILGEKKQSARNSNLGRLKTSYVAMTRATHLLCIAVRQKIINDKIEELKEAGWQVEVL